MLCLIVASARVNAHRPNRGYCKWFARPPSWHGWLRDQSSKRGLPDEPRDIARCAIVITMDRAIVEFFERHLAANAH